MTSDPLYLHNPTATEVAECDACLDMITNPKLRFDSDIQAFAKVDRAHFQAVRR